MTKISIFFGGAILVSFALIGIGLYQVRENLLQERRVMTRNLVESVLSIAQYNYDQAKSGVMSMEQAKEKTKEVARVIRFEQNGYFFIVNLDGAVQVHPIYPDKEKTDRLLIQDGRGTNVIQTVVETAKNGGGYVVYYYMKLRQHKELQPKLVYTQMFAPWNWAVATGVNIDDLNYDSQNRALMWLEIAVVSLFLLLVLGYYLSVFLMRPLVQLDEARKNAESATHAKSHFFANMSHEIRTPLNSAMGMLSLLMGTKLTSKQREWTQVALQSCESLLNLINDILDISKIESGHMKLELLPFDLQANIKAVTDKLYPQAYKKGIELLVAFQTDLPRMVVGDPVRLRQILINLVGNAIKFTTEGYILISVESTALETEFVLRFEVKDTGIGISKDKITYVFENFSQAEESTTRTFGGTGMGLAICRKLAGLMKGDVGARSALGRGSTFWFTVCLDKPTEQQDLIPMPRLNGTGRILVLHPHEMIRRFLCNELIEAGFNCEAIDGSDGLRSSLQQSVSLGNVYHYVFVDIAYFGHDVLGLTSNIESLLNISPMTDFILIASPEISIVAEEVVLRNNIGILTKPIFPQDIYDLFSAMVRGKENKNMPARFIQLRHDQTTWTSASGFKGKGEEIKMIDKDILVVEDQNINQILMRNLIARLGYKVKIASNGVEAVKLMAQRKFDLVFMDCHMPEMNGFEATKQIREIEDRINRHTPIIALTADAMKGDRDGCLRAGMDDSLQKPVKVSCLQEMIQKYIGVGFEPVTDQSPE